VRLHAIHADLARVTNFTQLYSMNIVSIPPLGQMDGVMRRVIQFAPEAGPKFSLCASELTRTRLWRSYYQRMGIKGLDAPMSRWLYPPTKYCHPEVRVIIRPTPPDESETGALPPICEWKPERAKDTPTTHPRTMEHWASVVERKKTSNHKVMDYTQKELPVQMEEVVHLVMEALYEARIQGRAPLFNIDAHRMLDLGAAYFQQALIDVALGRVETEIPDLCQEDEEWETEEETEVEMEEEETEESAQCTGHKRMRKVALLRKSRLSAQRVTFLVVKKLCVQVLVAIKSYLTYN